MSSENNIKPTSWTSLSICAEAHEHRALKDRVHWPEEKKTESSVSPLWNISQNTIGINVKIPCFQDEQIKEG